MKQKRILTIFLLILISLSFSSCTYIFGLIFPVDGAPWSHETEMDTSNIVITVVNNSSSEYKVRFSYGKNIDDSDFATFIEDESLTDSYGEPSFRVLKTNEKTEIRFDSSRDKKITWTCIFYVYDKSGNKVFSTCGWPEEWKSSNTSSWQIPSTDYDVYGIGYVDSDLNDNTNIYYVNEQGSLSNSFSVSYTCTINEDNSVSFVLNE